MKKRKFSQITGYRRSYAAPMAYGLGRYMGRMVANRYRSRGGMTRTRTQTRQASSGQGVTTQYDRRRIYRKKSMPRGKKRAWKRFVNKVHAVAVKDMGSRTVVFNSQLAQVNTTAGTGSAFTLALYGSRGQQSLDDLAVIATLENRGNPTATQGITVDDTTKIMFQSGVLDLTIRNSSTQFNGTSFVQVGAAKMEVDIYEISVRKQCVDVSGVNGYLNLSALFAQGLGDTANIGGAGVALAMDQRGVTPWDAPQALSRWGIKIYKKTKFFVPNGDTITYQIRDPKRFVTDLDAMANQNGCNMPKKTRFLYIMYQLVPGLPLGTALNQYSLSVDIGCTRKYLYKVEGANNDADRYISQSFTYGTNLA